VLELESLKNAITSFEGVLSRVQDANLMTKLDKVTKDGLKAGVIQNFEFTYELCWKFMKRWLEDNLGSSYVDGVSRRELFRIAAENHLIADVDRWMDYHKARNRTSHTYNEVIFEEVFEAAVDFLHFAKCFLQELERRND